MTTYDAKRIAEIETNKAAHGDLISLITEVEWLHGQGFEVQGWHQNGNTEPLANFFNNSGYTDAAIIAGKAVEEDTQYLLDLVEAQREHERQLQSYADKWQRLFWDAIVTIDEAYHHLQEEDDGWYSPTVWSETIKKQRDDLRTKGRAIKGPRAVLGQEVAK